MLMPSAVAEYPDWIRQKKLKRPGHRKDVTLANGELAFAVYYDDDDETLHQALQILPDAATIVARLTGQPPRPTPFLLFSDARDMQAYENIPIPRPPMLRWVRGRGDLDGVHFLTWVLNGGGYMDAQGVDFRQVVTHEYMHTAVARDIGARSQSTLLPTWFVEGIADYAGCQATPQEKAKFEKRFRKAVHEKSILTLEQFTSRKDFDQKTSAFMLHTSAADPYAQAYTMVDFLLKDRTATTLADLLARVRQTGDFAAAFGQTFGETPSEFETRWRADARL